MLGQFSFCGPIASINVSTISDAVMLVLSSLATHSLTLDFSYNAVAELIHSNSFKTMAGGHTVHEQTILLANVVIPYTICMENLEDLTHRGV